MVLRATLDRKTGNDVSADKSLLVEPGDVAYNMMRMWQGAVAVCKERCVISPAYVVCRPNAGQVDSNFMFSYFKSKAGMHKLYAYSYGVTADRLRLYYEDFGLVPAPLPSLHEQKAIAGALECWDKAIRALQQKIDMKQQIRKGLHQKIFASHHHQPCISKSWKSVRLGKIVDINKGQQLNRLDQTCSGEYPVLNGGVEPLGYTDKWNTERDTITISEGGNSCGFVNFNTERFWCGGHCYTLDEDKDKVNKLYLFQYLKHMQSSLMRLRVGSGLPNIQKKMLAQFEVLLPSIGRQLEIAKLMSAVDAEIMAFEKKLALFSCQKRFLLNNLVTGTIRLPQFCKAARKGDRHE